MMTSFARLVTNLQAVGLPVIGASDVTGMTINPAWYTFSKGAKTIRVDFASAPTPTQLTQTQAVIDAYTDAAPVKDYAVAIAGFWAVWIQIHYTLDMIAQTLPLSPTGAQVSANLQQQVAALVTFIQAQDAVVQNIFARRRWLAGVATATLTAPASATDAQLRLAIEAARSAANQGIAFSAGVAALTT